MGALVFGLLLLFILAWLVSVIVESLRGLGRTLARPVTHFTVTCPVCSKGNACEREEAARAVVAASTRGGLEKLVHAPRPCSRCGADLATTWRTHPTVRELVDRAESHRGTAESLVEVYGLPADDLPEDTPPKRPSRNRPKKRDGWW